MMKYLCTLSPILLSFQLSAAILDVEIQGITEGGALNLEICSSKEAFESDEDASGVVARVEESVGDVDWLFQFVIVATYEYYCLIAFDCSTNHPY